MKIDNNDSCYDVNFEGMKFPDDYVNLLKSMGIDVGDLDYDEQEEIEKALKKEKAAKKAKAKKAQTEEEYLLDVINELEANNQKIEFELASLREDFLNLSRKNVILEKKSKEQQLALKAEVEKLSKYIAVLEQNMG